MGIYHDDEPLSKSFFDLTSKEAKEYFNWYFEFIPNAVIYIKNEIQLFKGVENWNADFSLGSVKDISEWLFETTVLEEISLESIEYEIREKNYTKEMGEAMKRNRFRLPRETRWKCICVGMYFGEALKHNIGGNIVWDYLKKPKTDMHINQPILVQQDGLGNIFPSNSVVGNVLFNMLQSRDSFGLLEIYKRWERIFREGYGFVTEEFKMKLPGKYRKYIK